MNVFESPEQFASWVVEQTHRYTVNLEAAPVVARDEILRAAGAWPDANLNELDASAERSVQHSGESHADEVTARVSSLRCELQAAVDALFAVSANGRAAKRKRALAVVRKFVGRLQSDASSWEQLGSPIQFVLMLPIRKKAEMRALMEYLDGDFKHVWWSAVETALGLMRELQSHVMSATVNKHISARQSRERERAVANAYRTLVLRWRSQTRTRTMTIRPCVEGSCISTRFDIADSFPRSVPAFDPFEGLCGPDGASRPGMPRRCNQEGSSTQDQRRCVSLAGPRTNARRSEFAPLLWSSGEEPESGSEPKGFLERYSASWCDQNIGGIWPR